MKFVYFRAQMQYQNIPGLQSIKDTLAHAVNEGHVAHAQLFTGVEGGAAFPLAWAYIQQVFCEIKPSQDACGECNSCKKIQKFIHPDIHTIIPVIKKEVTADEDGNKNLSKSFMKDWRIFIEKNPYGTIKNWMTHLGSENKQPAISVEESRSIIQTASMESYEGGKKCFLIWYPELMNQAASNALLKILEEPPQNTLFILISYFPDKLLPTILSRTQLVKVPLHSVDDIRSFLVEKELSLPDNAENLAHIADGIIQQAIELCDQESNNLQQFFREWMRECYKFDWNTMFQLGESFAQLGRENQKNLILYGISVVRLSYLYYKQVEELVKCDIGTAEFVKGFSKIMNDSKIGHFYNTLNNMYNQVERNGSAKLIFTDSSIRIASIIRN